MNIYVFYISLCCLLSHVVYIRTLTPVLIHFIFESLSTAHLSRPELKVPINCHAKGGTFHLEPNIRRRRLCSSLAFRSTKQICAHRAQISTALSTNGALPAAQAKHTRMKRVASNTPAQRASLHARVALRRMRSKEYATRLRIRRRLYKNPTQKKRRATGAPIIERQLLHRHGRPMMRRCPRRR